jgi:hypothetical protein
VVIITTPLFLGGLIMAKKSTKSVKTNNDAKILRNYDIYSMEKRVHDMDNSPRRSYDLYSLEKRIYDLEVNGGGGGGGSTVKRETGTFISSSVADGIVTVNLSDIIGTPDLVIVKMVILGEYVNYFFYVGDIHNESSAGGNYWHNINNEAIYIENMAGTVSGIKSVTDGAFTFQSGNGDIAGIEATFVAYKWNI